MECVNSAFQIAENWFLNVFNERVSVCLKQKVLNKLLFIQSGLKLNQGCIPCTKIRKKFS